MSLREAWRLACSVFCVGVTIGCGGSSGPRPEDADPCDPNPCMQTGKTQCVVVRKAAVCGCDDGLAPDGRGGCESTKNWSAGVAGSAVSSSAATQYTAHVQVLDSDDKPIEGAKLHIGTRSVKTNVEGRAPFNELDTGTLSFLTISADGYVPALRQLSIGNAGMRELAVELVKQDAARTLDAGLPATLHAGNIDLALPKRAFVEPNGARVTGDIKAQVTGFAPSALRDRAWPGSVQARNANGQPTMIDRWFGAVHAEFKNAKGEALQLGAGSTAALTVELPADAALAAGQKVPLWALDEKTGLWMHESSCTVAVVESPRGTTTVCSGPASHFSYWAVATEWDIYTPGTLGCVNVTLDVKLPEGYAVGTQSILPMECKGEDCKQSVAWDRGQVRYFAESDGRQAGLCGVTSAQKDLRVTVQLRVQRQQTSADTGEATIQDGMYVYTTDLVDLSSFKEVLGFKLMLNQTFEPESDCSKLCKQVAISIDENSLKDLQRYADDDNDGSYVTVDEDQTLPWQLGKADCNDQDRNVSPYAVEAPCGGFDLNCDGQTAPDMNLSWRDEKDPWRWNWYACARKSLSCVVTEKEVRGNEYDEDCDGLVEDRDGDGYIMPNDYDHWNYQPGAGETKRQASNDDCNDYSAAAHPGGQEVPGNGIDEDCDGNWLDLDGDGHFAWGHEYLAFDQLGIDPLEHPEQFGDCDDFNPNAHPDVRVQDEVGSLRSLYYETAPGKFIRGPEFCDLFDDDGKPNQQLYDRARDLNCDGLSTDMDGDGWTAPGDTNLGAGAAFDCNDLDPRVHPAGTPSVEAPTVRPECESPPASQLMDRSICENDSAPLTAGCSPLPLEGKSTPTTCTEVAKVESTTLSLCLFSGWDSTGPLKWKPGLAWGPCDGVGDLLPRCPTGFQCAGGASIKYPPEFKKFLEEKYTDNKPIEYQGMCFKVCTPE